VPSLKPEAKSDLATAKAIPISKTSKGKRKREGLLGIVKKKSATDSRVGNGQAKENSIAKVDEDKSSI
jgi:hypothetical protein